MPIYQFSLPVSPLNAGDLVETTYEGVQAARHNECLIRIGNIKLLMSGAQVLEAAGLTASPMPAITSPITDGATTVSGTVSSIPDGSTVTIYDGATPANVIGTGTITNNAFTVTVSPALVTDDTVRATTLSAYVGAVESDPCDAVTVTA